MKKALWICAVLAIFASGCVITVREPVRDDGVKKKGLNVKKAKRSQVRDYLTIMKEVVTNVTHPGTIRTPLTPQ